MRIHFEDHGQDFLQWDLDNQGVVVHCEPFQAWLWVGCRVQNHAALKVGDHLRYIGRDGMRHAIKYAIEAIEQVPHVASSTT